MLIILVSICVLIWLILLFNGISYHGFAILLVWLFIGPIFTNILAGHTNPFFNSLSSEKVKWAKKITFEREGDTYKKGKTDISLRDILEPTRTLLGVFCVVFLLKTVIHKRPLVPLDKTEMWMGIFSLILVISALLQSNRLVFSLHVALDAFIVPFLGYYVARRLVTSEDRFRQLTQVLGYIGFYVIIACLTERLMARDLLHRVGGPFAERDLLYMAMVPVFYAVLLNEKQCFPRIVRRFLMFFIPLIIFLTLTRGNWVGFASGVGAWLFLSRRLIDPARRIGIIGLMLVLGTLIGISSLAFLPQDIVRERVANENTTNWRLLRWHVGIQEAIDKPIFGIGLNNLRDALGARNLNYSAVHQAFLNIFAEHGAVGLLVYLAMVKSIIGMGFTLHRTGACPQDRWRGVAVIAAMIAYQIPGFFNSSFYSFHFGQVYIFVFAGGIAGLHSCSLSLSSLYKFSSGHQRARATPISTYSRIQEIH